MARLLSCHIMHRDGFLVCCAWLKLRMAWSAALTESNSDQYNGHDTPIPTIAGAFGCCGVIACVTKKENQSACIVPTVDGFFLNRVSVFFGTQWYTILSSIFLGIIKIDDEQGKREAKFYKCTTYTAVNP
jgi:hypothetical protein